jgi:hypothetical protein
MEPTKSSLAILYPGNCEPLKATIHGLALALAAVMGAYNTAAWVRRRQSHFAINATIYILAAFREQRHVTHHLFPCLPSASSDHVDLNARAQDCATQVRAA